MNVRRWRMLTLLEAALFAVSLALLLSASTAAVPLEPGQLSGLGVMDVTLAIVVVLVGFAVTVKAAGQVDDDARRLSYNVATVLPALLLLAMWLYQDHLRWNVLLPGLAWRTFAILFSLPAALALWRKGK